jgi:hypothetical protein
MIDSNLMSGIIGAVSGLIGAFGGAAIGGWVSWKITRKQIQTAVDQKKLENTFNMHKEFFGESMNHSRTQAGKLICKYPDTSLEKIDTDVSSNESVHLWIVLGFYQRLSLMIKHKQIIEPYIPDLFGALFTWYWVNCFESNLPHTWDSYPTIKESRDWLEEYSKKADLIEWQRMAQKDKERNLSAQREHRLLSESSQLQNTDRGSPDWSPPVA